MIASHVRCTSARVEAEVQAVAATSPVPKGTQKSDSPGSTSSPNSPSSPKEVPLQVWHRRSEPFKISHQRLALRLDALEWLTQAFDALDLSDVQLVSAFGFLDR